MTDIIIVLDESGSMESMGKEPVQAMNKFIREQAQVSLSEKAQVSQSEKKDLTKAAPSHLSLYTFSSNIRKVIDNKPLIEIQEYSDYHPDGTTALYDCIGRAISENNQKENAVMVIITDGQDNSSHDYDAAKIKALISKKEKEQGWQVVFLAANQDAFSSGGNVGVLGSRCAGFQMKKDSLLSAMNGISSQVSAYRCLSSQGKSYSINLQN